MCVFSVLCSFRFVLALRFFQAATEESCIRVMEDEARITNDQFEYLIAELRGELAKD